jgi:hypothetical protein
MEPPGRFEILFWDTGRGVTTQLASITATLWIPAGPGSVFSTNHTGNIFVWSQVDHQESDLMLVDNFR